MISKYIQSKINRLEQALSMSITELREIKKERELIYKSKDSLMYNDRYKELNINEVYIKAKIDTIHIELELLAQDLRYYDNVSEEF